jgi:O-antigen ligase
LDGPAPAQRLDHFLIGALVALCFICSLVPTTFQMGELGPEAGHQIAEGSLLRQVQFGTIFLTAGWLAYRHPAEALGIFRRMNPFLILLLIYCAASIAWSPAPNVTIKRVVLLGGLLLTGIVISPPIATPRQFSHALLGTLSALVAVSAFVAVALPHIGVDLFLDGAWRGIMWQKNLLGAVAGLCVMLWLRECMERRLPLGRTAAATLFSIFVLYMSKSTTSMLVTAVGIAVYLALRQRWVRNSHAGLIASLVGLSLLLALTYLFYIATGRLPTWQDVIAPIATLLNKSPDLTGRTEIWRLVLAAARQHLTFGIGYGAFWIGEGGPAQFIADEFGWMPSHGHNGYIDLLNELGIVGLVLFIGLLLWHLASLFLLMRIDRDEAALHLSILVLMVISNFSESQFLRDVSLQNMVLVFSSVTVSARLRLARRDAPC